MTAPRLSALGCALVSEAFSAHPPPWSVRDSRVIDARGVAVVECAGNLAASALVLDVFGEFLLPMVNEVKKGESHGGA